MCSSSPHFFTHATSRDAHAHRRQTSAAGQRHTSQRHIQRAITRPALQAGDPPGPPFERGVVLLVQKSPELLTVGREAITVARCFRTSNVQRRTSNVEPQRPRTSQRRSAPRKREKSENLKS